MRRLERALALAVERPKALLAAALLSVVVALLLALRLELRPDLGELLPEGKESVQVAAAVAERLPTSSTLAIVAEGRDAKTLARYLDELVPRLERLETDLVGRIEAGPGEAAQFIERHALLYASLEDLLLLQEAAEERFAFEIHARAGLLLLDEEREPWSDLVARVVGTSESAGDATRYLDAERGLAAVLVRTPIPPGDLSRTHALRELVVGALGTPPSGVTVSLGGNLLTAAETYAQVKDDLSHVGAAGVALVLGVVIVFFRRLRPVLAMVTAVTIGTSWTFAAAYLLVGHLNAATGFLFSIVVGNGINFAIVLMARYLAARRHEEVASSLERAVRETWLPTLTAATAASLAYGSLAVSSFRGFRHFGLIAGCGMILCWVATYAFVPPLLVLFERGRPLTKPPRAMARPAAWLVARHPHATLAVSAFLMAAAGLVALGYLDDPMEYDLRRIDNRPQIVASDAQRLAPILDGLVGRQGQDGVAVAVDRLEQVAPLVRELERRRLAVHPPPFSRVVTAFQLLPERQPEKLAIAASLAEILERAQAHGLIPATERARLAERLAGARRALELDDLPASLVRPFTERDGSRGRLLYIVPSEGRSVWDGRYLLEWASSFRRVALPDGSVVRGSGRSVVFADMIESIAEEAPRVTLLSLGLTLLLVLVAFRNRWGLLVAAAVVCGLILTLGTLGILDSGFADGRLTIAPLRLNFLDFVALPLTIGIGADYTVNVVRRLEREGSLEGLGGTSGAVIACSLTTILGYGALTLSVNGAIRSFGLAAAAGEIACILVAVVMVPAVVAVARRTPHHASPAL